MRLFFMLFSVIDGYKTYVAALMMLIYAFSGYVLGEIDLSRSLEIWLEALSILGLRHAISKK